MICVSTTWHKLADPATGLKNQPKKNRSIGLFNAAATTAANIFVAFHYFLARR